MGKPFTLDSGNNSVTPVKLPGDSTPRIPVETLRKLAVDQGVPIEVVADAHAAPLRDPLNPWGPAATEKLPFKLD